MGFLPPLLDGLAITGCLALGIVVALVGGTIAWCFYAWDMGE